MARKNSIKITDKITKQASSGNYLEKLETEIQSNQSKVSLVLGALIVLVLGILIFNYFNRNKAALGPAQQTQTETQADGQDVSPENLPGKYTVKEDDTLFLIAEKYYKDGSKFTEIAKANNLTDVNQIEAGKILEIPKLETQLAEASIQPTASPEESASPNPSASPDAQAAGTGTGGGDTTIWGPKIEGKTYTVVADDWLSKIAGRAYGDVMAYERIAKANNISDPNLIEPGTVLTIPR
ncbi:LysM peptidoglycan-binding domain-containing protein [Candidatus Daviesbacteria bacterium]|nr:LysM peptidoglycan-binding domain-containing protein [Candidatus Daviesbacteria bacterium]